MLIELHSSACVQHPVAVLERKSDDAGLQEKPSERARKCCKEFVCSYIHTFADSGDAVFSGERSVQHLASAPGGESLGESRREHADHDKSDCHRGRWCKEDRNNDNEHDDYDEDRNASRSQRRLGGSCLWAITTSIPACSTALYFCFRCILPCVVLLENALPDSNLDSRCVVNKNMLVDSSLRVSRAVPSLS